jgi:hypothetical protein
METGPQELEVRSNSATHHVAPSPSGRTGLRRLK